MNQDKEKLSCAEITNDVLLDFAEGRLGEGRHARVQAHLDGCESCRSRAQDIRLIGEALKRSTELNEDIPVPESVDRAVLATISEVAGRQRRVYGMARTLRWLVPAAACVLVVVIIGLLTGGGMRAREAYAPEPSKRSIAMKREAYRERVVVGGVSEEPQHRDERANCGDMNGDGRVDVSDAMMICKHILSGETVDYRAQRDANGDGRIDVGDALYIVNKSLKEQG